MREIKISFWKSRPNNFMNIPSLPVFTSDHNSWCYGKYENYEHNFECYSQGSQNITTVKELILSEIKIISSNSHPNNFLNVVVVRCCYISALVLTCFRLKKSRATFFRPETIVASFLHLMVLFFKALLNYSSKRQSLVLHWCPTGKGFWADLKVIKKKI